MSIGILGFKTQTMAGRIANKTAGAFFTAFGRGDTSWTVPATGYYTFTARGGGGAGAGPGGGGGGGATQKTVLLFSGQVVAFTIGQGGETTGTIASTSSVITFPSGLVVTAGGGADGSTGVGGVASGGDININGNVAVGNQGGSSPAIGKFPAGTSILQRPPGGPGAGATVTGSPGGNVAGGNGVLYVQYGKPPK